MSKPRLLMVVLALTVAGCATKKWMMSRPHDSGIKAVYTAPFEKVKRSVSDSLVERGFSNKEKDEKWVDGESTYIINSSKGLSAGSTGQYARVVIQKTEAQQTVYVLVESKAATRDSNAADEDSAKGIQAGIEKRVTAK